MRIEEGGRMNLATTGRAIFLICAFTVLFGCTKSVQAPPQPDLAATPGVPFSLKVGQSAVLAALPLRLTLLSVTAAGKCPGGHVECVEVSPPTATVEIRGNAGNPARLDFPLFGSASPVQQAAGHAVRLLDASPYPILEADVAARRHTITLVVME